MTRKVRHEFRLLAKTEGGDPGRPWRESAADPAGGQRLNSTISPGSAWHAARSALLESRQAVTQSGGSVGRPLNRKKN